MEGQIDASAYLCLLELYGQGANIFDDTNLQAESALTSRAQIFRRVSNSMGDPGIVWLRLCS